MKLLTAGVLTLSAALTYAQEAWELYHAPETDGAMIARQIEPMLPHGTALRLRPLPATCANEQEITRHRQAIAAGVCVLPCLALRDAKGAYAALPIQGLTKERIQQAQRQASAPERAELARQRAEIAHLYALRLSAGLKQESDEKEEKELITALREVMQRPTTSQEMRQFIGLRCLYPALLYQYVHLYKGAHTPRSEAKLLEAIHALEEARDIDPLSYWGRLAYDERERLRAARLKSRQYE